MYPDFLCIGAQKAGTTWLEQNLRNHPQVWLPPPKAIRYFNDPSPRPLILRLWSRERKDGRWRRMAFARLVRLLDWRERENHRWFLRFLCGRRTDRWYGSLFTPGPGQTAGEVTPAYSKLDDEVVTKVHSLMPRLKIVYLLRNPIERMWSQAAMHFEKRGSGLSEADDRRIMDFLADSVHCRNSGYLRTLETWERHFQGDQIFCGFFDRLAEDPPALLKDVYRFLSVDDSDRYLPEGVRRMRNRRTYPDLPRRYGALLAKEHYGEICGLHERFQSEYTFRWKEEAEKALSTP